MVQTRRKTAAAAQDGAVKENKVIPPAAQTPTKKGKRGRPPKIRTAETVSANIPSTSNTPEDFGLESDAKLVDEKTHDRRESEDNMMVSNGIPSSSKKEIEKDDYVGSPESILREKKSSEKPVIFSPPPLSKRISINKLRTEGEGGEHSNKETERDTLIAFTAANAKPIKTKSSKSEDPISPMHPDDPQPSSISMSREMQAASTSFRNVAEPSTSTELAPISRSQMNSPSSASTSEHSTHQVAGMDESESMDIANSESEGENDTADVVDDVLDCLSSSIPLPASTPPPRKLSAKGEIHIDVDQKFSHNTVGNSPWDRGDEGNEKAATNPLSSPTISRPKIHFLHPAYSSFASDSMLSPNTPPPEPAPKAVENGSTSTFKMTFKKTPTNPMLKASALERPSTISTPHASTSTSNDSSAVDALPSPQKRNSNFGTTTANVLPPPQMVELPKLSFFNMPPVTKSVFSESDSATEDLISPKTEAPVSTLPTKHTESELQAAKAKAERIAQDITKRHEETRRLDELRFYNDRDHYDRRRDDRDRRDRRIDTDRKGDSDRRTDFNRRNDFDRRCDLDRRIDPDRRSDSDRRTDLDRKSDSDRKSDFDRRNDVDHIPRPRQRDEDVKRAFQREREVSRRHAREREEERIQRQKEEERKKKDDEEREQREQRELEETQHKEDEARRAEERRLKEDEMKVPEFELITECKYFTRNANKKRTESLLCECARTGGTCSDNTCVNRAMMTECPSSCIAKCKNQRFAKRKTASVEPFHTGTAKGCGLRALKDIKKGRFIIEYIGEVVERDDYEKRKIKYAADKKHKHHYLCDTGIYTIDATTYGNASRFVNHSCDPNAVCEKWSVPKTPGDISRIGFFAKRLIKAGEEITFDYQFVNYGRDAQQCLCGASSCTGWIGEKPEELSSSDDEEEEDDDLITTSHINMDEDQQEQLEELEDVEPYQRVELINEMLDDLNLRNKKHARKVITIATRMTDHTQREDLLRHLFSTDTNFGVQAFYAKEGMGTLMAAWLDADDYSLANLKLVQVILQTLHGDVFLACAKSESILLEVLSRWLNSSQGDWVNIHTVINALVTCTENPENNYEVVGDEAEKEILANFTRAKEMAFRLNHHWFNRSVSFRIPKKKPVPVESDGDRKEDMSSSQTVETDQSRAVSPSYHRHHHYVNSYFHDRDSHPRFFNNGNDIHQYRFAGYHGNNYKANYLTRRHRDTVDTYRDRRRVSRRSRSRSRSVSPPSHKRRKIEDRENRRTRSPVDRRNTSPDEKSLVSAKTENHDSIKQYRSESSSVAKNPETADAPAAHGYSQEHQPYPIPPGFDPYGYSLPTGMTYSGYHQNSSYFPPTYVAPHVPLTLETLPNRDVLIGMYEKATIEQLCERLKAVEGETELLRMFVRERQAENARIETERRRLDEEERTRRIRNMKYVWATAKDADSQTYYYNKITKETQWHLPTADQGLLEPEGYVCPVMAIVAEEQRQEQRMIEEAKRAEPKSKQEEMVLAVVKQEFDDQEGQSRDHEQRASTDKSSVSPKSYRDRDHDRREGSRNRDHINRDSYNESSTSERRIRDFKQELERSIRSEVRSHSRLRDSNEATTDKTTWLIKLIAKEMFKRESSQSKFDFHFSENTDKKVRNYTKSLIDRKMESNDLWKGYNGR